MRSKLEAKCSFCETVNVIWSDSYSKTVKRNGFYRCRACTSERYKTMWADPIRRAVLSEKMRASEAHKESRKKLDINDEKNGMYGRKHTTETKRLMSSARVGKTGCNATAWKGGKASFTKRVKRLLSTRVGWYARVFERDKSTCQKCPSREKLDAHHIESVVKIIKRIVNGLTFRDEEEKLEFVIAHPDIVDVELRNGITLCRTCHKQAHENWGSHVRP